MRRLRNAIGISIAVAEEIGCRLLDSTGFGYAFAALAAATIALTIAAQVC